MIICLFSDVLNVQGILNRFKSFLRHLHAFLHKKYEKNEMEILHLEVILIIISWKFDIFMVQKKSHQRTVFMVSILKNNF